MKYEIKELPGPFGYSRDGDGKVIYLFINEVDYEAITQVIENEYTDVTEDEDGNDVIDFSEYDPSYLNSNMIGEIEDELSMIEIVDQIKGNLNNVEKFELFLSEEVLAKNIPLIFVNSENKTISQINSEDIYEIIDLYQEKLIIYIREYDYLNDY